MKKIYKLHLELAEFTSTVYRDVLVDSKMKLSEFAYLIMSLFEMKGSHVFCFEASSNEEVKKHQKIEIETDNSTNICNIESDRYKIEMFSYLSFDKRPLKSTDYRNVVKVKLEEVLKVVNETLLFVYDYGNNWRIHIVLNEISINNKQEIPVVLAGASFGIIEDCGGVHGLKKLNVIFKEKNHMYESMKRWLNIEHFDIDNFDISDMNYRIKVVPNIFKSQYEAKLFPTEEEIKILERDYKK